MLKRLSINVKVFLAPAVITLLMLAVLLVSNLALRRQQDAFLAVVGGSLTTSTATTRLLLTVAELQSAVLRFSQLQQRVGRDDPVLLNLRRSILERYTAAEELFNSVKKTSGPGEADAVSNITDFLTIHRAVAKRILDSDPSNAATVSTLMAHYQQLQSYIVELASRSMESAQASEARTRAWIATFLRYLLFASALAVLFAIALTFYVGRAISKPLTHIVSLMSTIASGNSSVEVPGTERRDEIGAMARGVEAFATVTKDLRDREQSLMESRGLAEAASQHKSQFLANMSHELRTPLNSVLGFTEMLSDGIYGELPDKAKLALAKVEKNGRHLLGLINDILDLSKIEAGEFTLLVDEYSLPDVVQNVAASTESLARAKGLQLSCVVPRSMPQARGDQRRLTQILINLVGNAIKFTDEGRVEIEASCKRSDFEIRVRDTGPGIAPADQVRIFKEFQQVDDSSTRRKGGSGLGLAISRKMAEAHGGSISVESEVGKGSTFTVRIPVRVNDAVGVVA